MNLLINLLGLALIVGIVWWFWLSKRAAPAAVAPAASVIMVKDGVYEPERIKVPAHEETTLHFLREDPSPCAEYVVFADLDVNAQLAVGEETEVKLPAMEAGEYPFTCQMQMYRGTLVVA